MKSMQRLSLLLSRFWLQPRCFIYQLSLVIIRLCVFVDDMNVSHCCWLSQFTCSKMAMHIIKLFSFAKKKKQEMNVIFSHMIGCISFHCQSVGDQKNREEKKFNTKFYSWFKKVEHETVRSKIETIQSCFYVLCEQWATGKMNKKWQSSDLALKRKQRSIRKATIIFQIFVFAKAKKKKNGTTLTDGRSMQESSTHARDCKKETGQQKQCS